jgi:hypothetical protein
MEITLREASKIAIEISAGRLIALELPSYHP